MMNALSAILEVVDLRVYFRTSEGVARAVDGVSFRILPGETYALVGESGCGKSVTALSILRLIPEPAGWIAAGSIRFEGTDLLALPPARMREMRGDKISMIFQEPMTALNPVLTVGTQTAEVFRLHRGLSRRQAREQTIEIFKQVGIPDAERRCNHYPHQMSGGMRQRVMIAMALACRPRLLIADEPTTALDVTIQAQILSLVRELMQKMGAAVLLITHDMGVVRENADRVGVMYAGKLVEEAGRDALFDKPLHPYTQLLLRSLPSRATRGQPLAVIEGMVPRPTRLPPGCRFSNRCPLAMERCRLSEPAAYEAAPGHRASCFLLEQKKPVLFEATGSAPLRALHGDSSNGSVSHLELQDLQVYFPVRRGLLLEPREYVRAVDGVSLRVGRGETVGLVGESGCGKTTVGKCAVGLVAATAGRVLFRGRDMTELRCESREIYRSVQMVFQDPFGSLNPRRSAAEIVMEGMEIHRLLGARRERMQKARAVMERVGLDPNLLSRYPHEFSGGQRQRLGLARALAVDPEVIICDEATSSLDVSIQAQIVNLLEQLQSEAGLSYLLITHDLSVVKHLADRVCVMYLGRIVESGLNEEIFEAPAHPYTRALLSAVPQVDKKMGRRRIVLSGDVPSPINPPKGCRFHPRCPEARPECSLACPEKTSLTETHWCACLFAAGRRA